MSPWDVLGWLLVLMVSFGFAGSLLVAVALGVVVMVQRHKRIADVMAWEVQLPERTEWRSWEHGRATVVVKATRSRPRQSAPDWSASIKSDDLGTVFGSVPQIAKLLLQRRYRRI